MAMALDALDQTAASVLDGFLVRKDLVRKYSRQYPVPTYVVEFLLGRYCASVNESEINEGLAIVEKQLKDSTVRTGDEELVKSRAKQEGTVKIIDIVRARLDAKCDRYLAELPSLALRDVRIDEHFINDNERMLAISSATVLRAQSGMSPVLTQRDTVSRVNAQRARHRRLPARPEQEQAGEDERIGFSNRDAVVTLGGGNRVHFRPAS